jgi:hypothetical protein
VGHLAYEWIMSGSRWLQGLVAVAAAVLCFLGIVRLGQARNGMIDKVVPAPVVNSYVDGVEAENQQVRPTGTASGPGGSIRMRFLGQWLALRRRSILSPILKR